jgi:hypothetical protein
MGTELSDIGAGAFLYCTGLISVTIPNSVTNFDEFAFADCLNLTKVSPGSGVVTIGQNAFESCSKLVSIPFTTSLVYVGWNAFESCSSLTNFVIPDSVTSIGSSAFIGCSGLTTMIIPASVTNMEDSVFFECPDLTNFYFQGNAPYVYYDVFDGTNETGYYLPGTTGWSTNFSGLRMAPWLPQILPTSAALPTTTNQFSFNINWAIGQTVVVEACTNLTNPVWALLATNTINDGTNCFRDPLWKNYPGRFYRVRTP